ncbi:ACT domain-containing protein [Streptosporangium soli]|nr:ACT domain-containing protein [Streptosporangium sp. KLBMP 9127]
MLMRLRVSIPDRPGSLGQVARVLGTLGADIHQVTVLEREGGRVVDDFTVSWPGPPVVADVRDRLSAVPGVQVEGAWLTREVPGSAPDHDLLRQVVTDPARAFATLTDAVPDLAGADWAAVVTAETPPPAVVHRSWRTPRTYVPVEPVRRPAVFVDGETRLMSVPLTGAGLCLVVAREQGPAFHRAELDRIARVAEIVTLLAIAGASRTLA